MSLALKILGVNISFPPTLRFAAKRIRLLKGCDLPDRTLLRDGKRGFKGQTMGFNAIIFHFPLQAEEIRVESPGGILKSGDESFAFELLIQEVSLPYPR